MTDDPSIPRKISGLRSDHAEIRKRVAAFNKRRKRKAGRNEKVRPMSVSEFMVKCALHDDSRGPSDHLLVLSPDEQRKLLRDVARLERCSSALLDKPLPGLDVPMLAGLNLMLETWERARTRAQQARADRPEQ